LERREGYAAVLFENEPIRRGDVMLVFSHGGLNAADIEVLQEAKKRGLTTAAITSLDNYRKRESTHSSGKKLADVADYVMDNCVPAEDALVAVNGWKAPVAAGSTVSTVTIAMAIIAQVASELSARGHNPPVFVSPNVPGIPYRPAIFIPCGEDRPAFSAITIKTSHSVMRGCLSSFKHAVALMSDPGQRTQHSQSL
jgi:uncharacterized phosphosugar-binding protein